MRTTTTAPTTRRGSRRRTFASLAVIGALAVAACSGNDDDSGFDAAADEPASEEPADSADDGGFATGADAPADFGDDARGDFDIGIVGRDVIIEMRVVVSTDNIQRTVSSIMAQASALGGGVASSEVDYGSRDEFGDDEGYAVLVVKVPPQSIDSLLAGLDDTGTVLSINQSAQDVTEQLIDLDVRISNARQSVANVRQFMERTENLTELVALEGELTRRQTELERLEAQQRNLSDRVALSTVTIEVVPTASVPEPADDDDSIGDAFEKGWDAFVEFVFGVGYVLAVLLPFIVLGAIAALIGTALVRRRNRRRATTATEHAGDHALPDPVPTAAGAPVSSDGDDTANRRD